MQSLSLANAEQPLIPAGHWEAVNLFERGTAKNLPALQALGYTITCDTDGEGYANINFLGISSGATYDQHYFYLTDGTAVPYYFDGHTATAAIHQVEFDMVKVN